MADDLSLQPLQITPEMARAARQEVEAEPQPSQSQDEQLAQLKAMFDNYDDEVVASILAANGNDMELTIQHLLDMGADGPSDYPAAVTLDTDEELALMLFQQFAEDAEVPDDVKEDPARYEAWIKAKFTEQFEQPDSAMNSRLDQLMDERPEVAREVKERGKTAFMERMKSLPGFGRRSGLGVVKIEQGTTPLLNSNPDRV